MEIIQPAQLSFLAIYNPSLGQTDETLYDQVVYYFSAQALKARKTHGRSAEATERVEREERNERLRQIGLAQGMVEFAKSFSEGQPVDAIDAEKSRIVLHELEPGWWILASIDLTRLRSASSHSRAKTESNAESAEEYSAREVAPQELLLQQLLRAHRVFLLHHAASLADLYVRLNREKFCSYLQIFWNRFVALWDVLLHGNPSVDLFNGVKLAAGGELGVGVGEEEWGSGEREVLEGFVGRTEGLVDLVVSRFGDAEAPDAKHKTPWLGTGMTPAANDGVIFSGVGTIMRASVRSLSTWMENVYRDGVLAFGVQETPQSARRRRRRKQLSLAIRETRKSFDQRGRPSPDATSTTFPNLESPPGIPPPIVRAADDSLAAATSKAGETQARLKEQDHQSPTEPPVTEPWVKYMTLGVYGSSWGIPSGRPRSRSRNASAADDAPSEAATPQKPMKHVAPRSVEASNPNAGYDVENGCFLIGLRGDLSDTTTDADVEQDGEVLSSGGERAEPAKEDGESWDRRIVVRTLHLERHPEPHSLYEQNPAIPYHDRFRIVLYARRPFIYAFVFSTSVPTLSYAALYRSLHQQLGPLHKPLLRSTSAAAAQERTAEALRSPALSAAESNAASEAPIWDLIYDPAGLTVVGTLPGIPEPGAILGESSPRHPSHAQKSRGEEWTRIEALSVHSQIVSTLIATRKRPMDCERVMKTGRGWWIVWLRHASSEQSEHRKENERSKYGAYNEAPTPDSHSATASASAQCPAQHEAILVRPSSDVHGTPASRLPSARRASVQAHGHGHATRGAAPPAADGTASNGLSSLGGFGWSTGAGSLSAAFNSVSSAAAAATGSVTGGTGSASASPVRQQSGAGRERDRDSARESSAPSAAGAATATAAAAAAASKMVEGIGVDARSYVEGLLRVRR